MWYTVDSFITRILTGIKELVRFIKRNVPLMAQKILVREIFELWKIHCICLCLTYLLLSEVCVRILVNVSIMYFSRVVLKKKENKS